MKLIVYIRSSGPNVNLKNLRDVLTSFARTNKEVDYKFYLIVEEQNIDFVKYLFANEIGDDKLLEIKTSKWNPQAPNQKTWAEDFNLFLKEHGKSSEWLLISHDDVLYVTDDYFNKMIEPVVNIQDSIGWMVSTNEQYYKDMINGQSRGNYCRLVFDHLRPGNHPDHDKYPHMFHLRDGAINYPEKPVFIHGPQSSVMLIPMKSMVTIGECEDWSEYTMLVDEDWSLRALQNNLRNVWVPSVHHLHPLRPYEIKVGARGHDVCHAKFKEKWGFQTGNDDDPYGCSIHVDELREKYKGTLIPWSTYRNSYDWEYVEDLETKPSFTGKGN